MLRKCCYYYWEWNTVPGWRVGDVGDPAMPKAAPSPAFSGYTVQWEDRLPQRVATQNGQSWDGGAQKGCLNVGGVVKEGFMEEGRAEHLCGG